MERPRSHGFEFGKTFRVAGEGMEKAEGKIIFVSESKIQSLLVGDATFVSNPALYCKLGMPRLQTPDSDSNFIHLVYRVCSMECGLWSLIQKSI